MAGSIQLSILEHSCLVNIKTDDNNRYIILKISI